MEILSNGTTQYTLNLSGQSLDETDVTTQEHSTDITIFLFPAIGALLMLVFVGLLLSSGTTLNKTQTMPNKKYKKKFEQQYGCRTIRFHNIPEKITKEPSSVLQQENNDIVDAVKKQYQDLPQYQPVSGFVGSIAGMHGQTCAVNISKPEVTRPEVIDRSVSPIHCTPEEHTSDYENPSYKDNESDTEHENGDNEKRALSITLHDNYFISEQDTTERNPTASSGIGTNSPDTFEVDSLEEFPASENNSIDLVETDIPDLEGRGSSRDSAPRPSSAPAFYRGVYSGGRLSVLELESVPSSFCIKGPNCSIHRTEAENMKAKEGSTRVTNERLTWGDIATTGNLVRENQSDNNKTRSDTIRLTTPPAEISGPLTTENMREISKSPLRRIDLEKWLHDVEESRKTRDEVYDQTLDFPDAETEKRRREYLSNLGKGSVSSRRRMRAPLQESLQLLRKLQLVSEDDMSSTQDSVHRGGRASCLNAVRAPSSLCLCGRNCTAHCQNEITSDQMIAKASTSEHVIEIDESMEVKESNHQLDLTRTECIAKGGRQSSLNLLRASSGMCIHGPSCQVHCQKMGKFESITESGVPNERNEQLTQQQEVNFEQKELRGASVFGDLQFSSKNNTLTEQGNRSCALEQRHVMSTEGSEKEPRGASTFGGVHTARNQAITDLDTRGASSFAEQQQLNSTQSDLHEIRGASCFVPLDDSIVGTSSVTLSFAVESDTESFLPNKTLGEKKRSGPNFKSMKAVVRENRDCKAFPTEKQSRRVNSWKTAGKERFVETNNNLLASSDKDCKTPPNVLTKKTGLRNEQKQNSKRFDERILKVGKDTEMMSTLLNALRRDGEQKRKDSEPSTHNISHCIDKENVSSGEEASVGNLKFSVLYKGAESATPLLYVTVLGLEGILNEQVTSKHTAYVKVCLSPKFATWRRTRALRVSDKLVFKDHFIISGVKPVDLEEAVLRFVVVGVEEHERVNGELEVPLEELKSRDKLKKTCPLHAPCAKEYGTE